MIGISAVTEYLQRAYDIISVLCITATGILNMSNNITAAELSKIIMDEFRKEDKRKREPIIYATSQEVIDLWNEAFRKLAKENAKD